jgi:2-C-methyl-D-erythritol 4-phosphate cytidylyltransferase
MTAATMPKQFLEIHGKPIIVHTLEHFETHPDIDAVVVAIHAEWRSHFERLARRYELTKVRWVVDGGETGQESRNPALQALHLDCADDAVVLIHDGVRPLIDADLITRNIEAVRARGAAVTCTKFNETIIFSHGQEVDEVVPRDHIYVAQAPQSFLLGEVLALYDRAVAEGEHDSIDSCSLMKRYGHAMHRVEGPRSNIKITTAEDFYMCRTFFEIVENRQIGGL